MNGTQTYSQGSRVQLRNSYDYGCDTGTVRGHLASGTLAVDLDNGLKVGCSESEVMPHVNTVIGFEVTNCATGNGYVVKFATEAQAVGFYETHKSTHAMYELESLQFPPECVALHEVFYPKCEHGLSLDLCAGPGHYPHDFD